MFSTIAMVGKNADSDAICRLFLRLLNDPAYDLSHTEPCDVIDSACGDINPINSGAIDGRAITMASFRIINSKSVLMFCSQGQSFIEIYSKLVKSAIDASCTPDDAIAIVEGPAADGDRGVVRIAIGSLGHTVPPSIFEMNYNMYDEVAGKPNLFSKPQNDAKYYALNLFDPEWLE